ncbi:hypothetical protein SscP1EGY_37 [Streptomyces phage SscP1EGY]|nr:hypothetical protein SscP1EGY_37 [Streptomyces phage SscP1EGY]
MGDLFKLNQNRATRAKGTTTIMANNSKTNVTAADVAAKAAEEKLVVPAQGEKVTEETVVEEKIEVTEEPELTVIEGGKKTLKERAKALAEKVKANQKTVVAVGIAAAAATVAVAKVVAKRSVEKELTQAENETAIKFDENGHMIDPDKVTEESAA